MIDFDQNQIKDLKGSFAIIARSCGVTYEYVRLILKGKRNNNTPKAIEVVNKAKSILEIINN